MNPPTKISCYEQSSEDVVEAGVVVLHLCGILTTTYQTFSLRLGSFENPQHHV